MALLHTLRTALRLQAPGLHPTRASTAFQLLRGFAAAPDQMALIKELREQTGAPITDVKAALKLADWDLDGAVAELRKKGLAAASKKASRHAAEGLVGVAHGEGASAVVEVNAETDFVARNDQFKSLVTSAASAAALLAGADPAPGGAPHELDPVALSSAALPDGQALGDAVAAVAATVRENVRLRRGFRLAAGSAASVPAAIGSYIHGGVAPGLGRIAALVALEGSAAPEARELADKLAMQVVGARARYLDRAAVPAEVVEGERALLREQALKSGKPAAIVDKMVEGRLGKLYEELCLLEQRYLLDDAHSVAEVLRAAGAALGAPGLRVAGFVRVQVGEGLEAAGGKDFAEEVAELAGTK